MARTIKHQVIVYVMQNAVNLTRFVVIKVLEGKYTYRSEFVSALDAYYCAMDYARDNGKHVHILHADAQVMERHGVSIDLEWDIRANNVSLFDICKIS